HRSIRRSKSRELPSSTESTSSSSVSGRVMISGTRFIPITVRLTYSIKDLFLDDTGSSSKPDCKPQQGDQRDSGAHLEGGGIESKRHRVFSRPHRDRALANIGFQDRGIGSVDLCPPPWIICIGKHQNS